MLLVYSDDKCYPWRIQIRVNNERFKTGRK